MRETINSAAKRCLAVLSSKIALIPFSFKKPAGGSRTRTGGNHQRKDGPPPCGAEVHGVGLDESYSYCCTHARAIAVIFRLTVFAAIASIAT